MYPFRSLKRPSGAKLGDFCRLNFRIKYVCNCLKMKENRLKFSFHSIPGILKNFWLKNNVSLSLVKTAIFGRLILRKTYVCKCLKMKEYSLKCCFHSIPGVLEHFLSKNNVFPALVKTAKLGQNGQFLSV